MARPRRPFGGVEDLNSSHDKWLARQNPGAVGVRQQQRWESSQHWSYRQPNGLYDPLTMMLVLDAVANIDPDVELRAGKLAEWLNQASPQFFWDPVTVGKLVSDLCDNFEDALGAKNGILERGRDYKGHFFLLHHNPRTAAVFYRVRDELMAMAELERSLAARGQRSKRLTSPLNEVSALRGEFVDPNDG